MLHFKIELQGHQSPVVQQQMLSQQEILNQQMLQMQQLQMANQQRLHQSQPILVPPSQQPVNVQRPMSQQVMGPVSQQIQAPPVVQQVVQQPQLSNIASDIAQLQSQHQPQASVMAQQNNTVPNQQQYVTQQNGIQYVHLSNGMLMPMMTQQLSQQQPPQVSAMAQQNYIVPNQQQTQPQQQQTNTVNSQPKPVSSFNKHTYSSITESNQPKAAIADSKNAQRAQLAKSQDAGLKCSQI